ncbi:hypothetical protein ACWDRX_37960, partial [Streptomyces nigra]
MTTADRLQRAVRRQTGLGRLLPLGGARDGAWIFEKAMPSRMSCSLTTTSSAPTRSMIARRT